MSKKKAKELMGTEEALNILAEQLLAVAEQAGVTLTCMQVEEEEEEIEEIEEDDEEAEDEEMSTEDFINGMEEEDELKEIAKALKIKGYAKMDAKKLKKAILAIEEDDINTVLEELGYTGEETDEEVDEDDEEEGEDEEMSIEEVQASLEEADEEDLKEICKANKLKAGKTKKTAIKAIIEALEAEEITLVDIFGEDDEDEEEADEEDEDDAEDEEEEESEGFTEEEIADFLAECTKEEITKIAKSLKVKEGANQKATIKAIVAKGAEKVYETLVKLDLVEA